MLYCSVKPCCVCTACHLHGVYVSLPAVIQMSTRWRRCSNCTCVSFLSLWSPGLSTRTSWTAPTRWTPMPHRCILFQWKKNVCVCTWRRTSVCFNLSLRVGKSWSNKLQSSPESTTTFSATSAGEWKVECKASWDIPQSPWPASVDDADFCLVGFCLRCSCTPWWTRWT